MPYTKFQFIAYQAPTVLDVNGAKLPTLDAGRELADRAFAPIAVNGNLPDDARKRLKRLAAVVKLAKDELGAMNNQHDTLKVFMVPEFYFRPPSTAGARYRASTYTYDHALQIFEALNAMFVHADFQDWLFVFGTVMWNWPGLTTDYRNSATYIKGNQVVRVNGNDVPVDALRLIEKDVASHIDGVPNPYAKGRGAQPYDPNLEETFRSWELRRGHVFDVGGVVCGLEVCLDHAGGGLDDEGREHRVLKKVLVDWTANEPNRPLPSVALHLLTAGGMDIDVESVAATPGGYILRNDGFSAAGDPPPVELRRVVRYRRQLLGRFLTVTPSNLDGKAELGRHIQPLRWIPVRGAMRLPIPRGWFGIDQGLFIYDALDLPR